LLTGGLTWSTARVFATLVGASYVPNFETDTTVGNVPSGALLSSSVQLTDLVASGGYAAAAPTLSFGTISTDAPIAAILLTYLSISAPGSGPIRAPQETDKLLLLLDEGVGFGATPINTLTTISWNTAGIWRP
jgi:hypothetical protein